MEELSELLLQRRRKVDTLWEAGINPYPNDFKPLHTSADIAAAYGDTEQLEASSENLVVAGRILARRSFGKAAFIQLQDRKGRLQIYVKKDEIGEEAFLPRCRGFQVTCIGQLVLLAPADAPLLGHQLAMLAHRESGTRFRGAWHRRLEVLRTQP